MLIGVGFIQDMIDKVKENLARLPSKQSKFMKRWQTKFMEGRQPENTYKQNVRKVNVKEVSKSELEDVIDKIKLDAQEEKRKWKHLTLPLIILISILILIVIIFVFEWLLNWYWTVGKEYMEYTRIRRR